MLADGPYLVPDDIKNFRNDSRDVRQAIEPPYCADLATGDPLFSKKHSTGRLCRSLAEYQKWLADVGGWSILSLEVDYFFPK